LTKFTEFAHLDKGKGIFGIKILWAKKLAKFVICCKVFGKFALCDKRNEKWKPKASRLFWQDIYR